MDLTNKGYAQNAPSQKKKLVYFFLQRDDLTSGHGGVPPHPQRKKKQKLHILTVFYLSNYQLTKQQFSPEKIFPFYLDTSLLNHHLQVSSFWTKCQLCCLVLVPRQLYPNLGNRWETAASKMAMHPLGDVWVETIPIKEHME